MEHLVVVGAGMAAGKLVQDLLARRYPGRITVVGEEADPPYSRVGLAALAVGQDSVESLWSDEEAHHSSLTFVPQTKVVSFDAEARTVTLGSGDVLAWDKLVLAQGADAVVPPVPGLGLSGVHRLRTKADAVALAQSMEAPGPLVVVGGGVLGLETADVFLGRGREVTLVHRVDRLMEVQLDPRAASVLADRFRDRGLEILLASEVVELVGTHRVEGVRLADRVVPASAVLFSTGAKPRVELARAAGLAVNRGVVVDDHLQTSRPGVFAIGDVAEHRGQTPGLIAPAFEQASALAQGLCGGAGLFDPGLPPVVRLKAAVPVLQFGTADGHDVIFADRPARIHQRLTLRDQRLVAATLVGGEEAFDALELLYLSGDPVTPPVSNLLFPREGAQVYGNPRLWPPQLRICQCHGVTVADLATARSSGKSTRAGQGCGACQNKVRAWRDAHETGTPSPRTWSQWLHETEVRGYTPFLWISYSLDLVMGLGFVVSLVTGVLKFPGLLGDLGISLRHMPMPLIMDLHDWGSLAFAAAAVAHLALHWGPLVRFVGRLFKVTSE